MATGIENATLSDEQLEQRAFQVLARELGLANYARFLRLFCSGKGDYTAERHQWLSGVTLEDIERDLAAQPRTEDHAH